MRKSNTANHRNLFHLTSTALFAALACVTTLYFHIPFGTGGGYIHIGDALIYLAACILPPPYAMAAGAIGGSLADLLTAPMWAPATFLIKMLIPLPFSRSGNKFITYRNGFALCISGTITILGYYVAECVIYGCIAAVIPSMLGNLIQTIGSGIIFLVLGHGLDCIHFKARL